MGLSLSRLKRLQDAIIAFNASVKAKEDARLKDIEDEAISKTNTYESSITTTKNNIDATILTINSDYSNFSTLSSSAKVMTTSSNVKLALEDLITYQNNINANFAVLDTYRSKLDVDYDGAEKSHKSYESTANKWSSAQTLFSQSIENIDSIQSYKSTMNSNIATLTKMVSELEAAEAKASAVEETVTAKSDANAYTDQKIAELVASSPSSLDTLNELAAALGDDPNFATTVSNNIGTKMTKVSSTDNAIVRFNGTTGEVQNSGVTIDDSNNIVTSGTVDGRDVSVDGAKLDGIESGATADQTASEILTLIKTVDGSGSGLDADLLNGLDSTAFMRSTSFNGYYGLQDPAGSTSNWIRTTSNGLIPYQSGGNGSLGTSSWPFSTGYINTMYGVSTSANYADVAENYHADSTEYVPGQVMGIGGINEVTLFQQGMKVAGVISTNPGLIMNNDEEIRNNPEFVEVALKGKIPCMVKGFVQKGQYVIASEDGYGIGINNITTVEEMLLNLGVALEDSIDNMVMIKV